MKILTFYFLFFPLIAFSQAKDSVIIYEGTGAFENRIIDMSHKRISDVPARVVNFETEVLILDNNDITELPDWLTTLPKLRTLSVRNNNLKEVDVLMYCDKLEELYLSGNKNLNNLPNLSRCKNLRIIDVTNTQIHDLPLSIRGMENFGYFKYSVKK